MTEMTIDLRELLRHVLRKWKLLLLCALIGAVVLNFYGVRKAQASAASSATGHARYAEAAKDLPGYYTEYMYNLRSSLSDHEAAFAEAYASVYKGFIAEYGNGNTPENDDHLEAYMTFLDSYKDVLSVMSGTQRSYFDALLYADTDLPEDSHPEVTETSVPTVSAVQTKWCAIGALCGVLLAALCIVLPYVLAGKLRSAQDLERSFGVPVLGQMEAPNGLPAEVAAGGIAALLKKKQLSALVLLPGVSPRAEALACSLQKQLESLGVSVYIGVAGDAEGNLTAQLPGAGCVLIAERGKDRYTAIRTSLELCRSYEAEVLGCLVLE